MQENTVATAASIQCPDRTGTPVSRPREHYIDHLRTVLTVQVIVFHCAITYGSFGGWFYHEVKPSDSLSSTLLSLFVLTGQSYFMGFFFLLAGYFTPSSLERKGYARFLADRFLRLGLPLLAFGFLLGPLTIAMSSAARGDGFLHTLAVLWQGKDFDNGPLWFTQALLIFCVVYCVWRAITYPPLTLAARSQRPIPKAGWWLVSAITVGIAAVLLRIGYPAGETVFGLQLGFFSSYIFLFALGIAAWRHDWLQQLTWQRARWWILCLPLLWVLMPIHLSLDHTPDTFAAVSFTHGISWAAIFWAMWEPFVAWGFIAAFLLLFRHYVNTKTPFWSWLDRRAYTAYIIHPVVLVGIALLLRPWVAPALVKWACTGTLAVTACWLIADPLVRAPGLRRIL
ncbi:MAG: acyltransferase [Acidobacteriaceae bacterium]|nr:acyltransferase [Acidobacteriaceae bacterium]